MVVKFLVSFSVYVAGIGVLGLLQYCFAALHLFNVAAMFWLNDLSKHI